MFRKTCINLCLSFIVLLSLAACGSTTGAGANVPNRTTAEEVVSGSFTAEKPHVIVETFNGTIDVSTGSGNAIKIDVTKRGGGESTDEAKNDLQNVQVSMNQEGAVIHVTATRTDKRTDVGNSGAAVKLVVPAEAQLELKTSNGKVTTSGASTDVTVQDSNGAIDVRGATGALDLTTSNGDITVDGGSADLKLKTSNGAITVKTNKDVQIVATTSNGAINFNGPLADKSKNTLQTDNAAIIVTLPAKAGFTLNATTSNGKVTSTFAVKGDNTTEQQLKGTVGDGAQATVNLNTSNGNIEVRKGG